MAPSPFTEPPRSVSIRLTRSSPTFLMTQHMPSIFAEGFTTWAVTSALDDTIVLGLGLMPIPVTGKIILAVVGVFKGKKAGAEKH